uniref:SCP domain-containing protein n=1 Tax=Mesocestoides corti TaxID=53468 RepID=A0A5K3EHD1_MESCO
MQRSTYLLALIVSGLVQALDQEGRCTILEHFTKLREDVDPAARNMLLMKYSLDLEKLADDWLANCTLEFPFGQPGFYDVGYLLIPGIKSQPITFDLLTKLGFDKRDCRYET